MGKKKERKSFIEVMSDSFKSIIDYNSSSYYIYTKSDIIDENTFIRSIAFKYGDSDNQEIKYVYHMNDDKEYICMVSDIISEKIHSKEDIWKRFTYQIGMIFDFGKKMCFTKDENVDEDIDYLWKTFILKEMYKEINRLEISDYTIKFPKFRFIHQSSENIMALLITSLNRAVIFTLPAKTYNLRPDIDLMTLFYEDLKKMVYKEDPKINNNSKLITVDTPVIKSNKRLYEEKII